MQKRTVQVCLLLALVCLQIIVQAQQSPINLSLERFLVNQETQEGELVDVLVPAFELVPSNVIEEQLTASNVTEESLAGISLELPIPQGTYFLADSALSLELANEVIRPQFSFDSASSFAFAPLFKMVTVLEDGKEVQKEVMVDPSEYTHVRWLITSLEPQENVMASFRAVVR